MKQVDKHEMKQGDDPHKDLSVHDTHPNTEEGESIKAKKEYKELALGLLAKLRARQTHICEPLVKIT